MLIRSHIINSLLKLHVVVFAFCILHSSLNLDVVSLVIRLIVFCCHLLHTCLLGYPDSGISPFWFALYKLHNFLVIMSFVYIIGVCNKMVLICNKVVTLNCLEKKILEQAIILNSRIP